MRIPSAAKVMPLFVLLLLVCAPQAAHASEDILSLNKTFFFQLIIFVVAIFVFNSLLFKPLLELSERRRKLTIGAVKEAEEFEEKSGSLVEDYERRIRSARAELQLEREGVKRRAQEDAMKIIDSARAEAQSLIGKARVELESESKEIKGRLKPEIEEIAGEIASAVLGREVKRW